MQGTTAIKSQIGGHHTYFPRGYDVARFRCPPGFRGHYARQPWHAVSLIRIVGRSNKETRFVQHAYVTGPVS
jgi:hypothetical protein